VRGQAQEGEGVTVSELIEFLKGQPQDLQVAFELYSEQCLLRTKDIEIQELSEPRNDGWVPNKRPDKPTQKYLVFPGN
jgi:hypothetical protein